MTRGLYEIASILKNPQTRSLMTAYLITAALGSAFLVFVLRAMNTYGDAPVIIGLALSAIALITVVLFWKRPDIGLLFCLSFTPFQVLLTEYFGSAKLAGPFSAVGTIKDLALIILLMTWGLRVLAKNEYSIVKSPLNALIVCFGLVGVIYAFRAPKFEIGLWGLRSHIEFMTIFFLTVSIVKDEKTLRRAYVAILIPGLLLATLGFWRMLTTGEVGWGAEFGVYPEHVVGRLSLVERETTAGFYGTYFSLFVTLSLGLILLRRNWLTGLWWKLLLYALLFLSTVTTLFTFSRRAWVGVLSSVVVLLMLTRRTRILATATAVLIAAVVTIRLLQPEAIPILLARATSAFEMKDVTVAPRFEEWSDLWHRALDHGLMGEGLGVVGPVGVRFGLKGASNTHSYYMMILVEMGVIGLCSFLLLMEIVLLSALKAFRSLDYGFPKAAVAATLGCLCSLLVQSAFTIGIAAYPFNAYFWFFVGVAVAGRRTSERRGIQQSMDASSGGT